MTLKSLVVITPDDKISSRTFIFPYSVRIPTQLADTNNKYDVEAYSYIFLILARPLPSRPEDAG